MDAVVQAVQDYGITTVMAVGMGYFIFFIWKYVTEEILPALEKATMTVIGLIDRIRMLDNDMIRMDQKINTIIELQMNNKEEKKNQTPPKMARLAWPKAKYGVYLAAIIILFFLLILYKDLVL